MRKKVRTPQTLDQSIIRVVKNENPATVEELVKHVQLEHPLPEEKIIEHILSLRSQGKLILHERRSPPSPTIKGYLLSPQAYWYWTIMILAVTTTILVSTVPENTYPIVYVRYLLGSIFVLWLPGYSLIKALFPKEAPIPTRTKELDRIERIALSIGMSLTLVALTGLLLNYTPWGIRTTPVILSLLFVTMTLATVALVRQRNVQGEENTREVS